MKDFSKLFVSTKFKCAVGSLATYPWNPVDLGEEWIQKAYGPNDQPLCKDIPLAMYMDKVPLRSTSQLLKDKNIRPPAMPSSVATPQQGTAPVLCNVAVACLDFEQQVQVAFACFVSCFFLIVHLCHSKDPSCGRIDAFLTALDKFTEKYAGDGPGSQHQAGGSSVHVPVPALMNGSVAGSKSADLSEEMKDPEMQVSTGGPRTLAEFEEQAFKRLSAKAKSKCKGLKRPAAAAAKAKVSSQKASPKASSKKAVKSKNGWKPACGVFGCLRCRGNIAGCSTCWSPLFKGERFSSRQEWKDFMAKHANQKKNKKCQKNKK